LCRCNLAGLLRAVYGADLFLYDGRYYTVRDDQWFSAARHQHAVGRIAIGKVPQPILAVPVGTIAYRPVTEGRARRPLPSGPAKKGRC
jgi:hypothetical protein